MRARIAHSIRMTSSARVQNILALAAELSREECEEVTEELLSVLDPGEELGADAWENAWREELARRAADRSPGVPIEDVRKRIEDALIAVRAKRVQ